MLPFLQKPKVPQLRKMSGVSKYGFSDEDELMEHACRELVDAYHAKDSKLMMQAMETLVELIRNKNASSTFKEASSL